MPGKGGGTPNNGLYGEAPPERDTLFRLQIYEREGISLVEVSERVGKSVIVASKMASKRLVHFMSYMAVKKSRKRSGLSVIYSNFKDSTFTEVKGAQRN